MDPVAEKYLLFLFLFPNHQTFKAVVLSSHSREFILAVNPFSTSCEQQEAEHTLYGFPKQQAPGLNGFHFVLVFLTERRVRMQQSPCWPLKLHVNGWYFPFLSLQYESKKRISAEEAMKHSYFRQLGMRVHTLPESERTFTRTDISQQSIRLRASFLFFFAAVRHRLKFYSVL